MRKLDHVRKFASSLLSGASAHIVTNAPKNMPESMQNVVRRDDSIADSGWGVRSGGNTGSMAVEVDGFAESDSGSNLDSSAACDFGSGSSSGSGSGSEAGSGVASNSISGSDAGADSGSGAGAGADSAAGRTDRTDGVGDFGNTGVSSATSVSAGVGGALGR